MLKLSSLPSFGLRNKIPLLFFKWDWKAAGLAGQWKQKQKGNENWLVQNKHESNYSKWGRPSFWIQIGIAATR